MLHVPEGNRPSTEPEHLPNVLMNFGVGNCPGINGSGDLRRARRALPFFLSLVILRSLIVANLDTSY